MRLSTCEGSVNLILSIHPSLKGALLTCVRGQPSILLLLNVC